MKSKKTIVFIISLGHSGSTLLGNILGAHSKVYHIGELVAPIQKKRPIICMDCLEDPCPIWNTVLFEQDLLNEYKRFKNRHSKLLFLKYGRTGGSIYKKYFNNFKNKEVIIDGSKNIEWSKFQSKNKAYTHKFIFLKRNPKAVFASIKRSYNKSIIDQLKGVIRSIDSINLFYKSIPNENKFVINYESMIENFEYEIDSLLYFLGLYQEPSMRSFLEYPNHIIGGNQANFIQKNREKAYKLGKIMGYSDHSNDYEFYSFDGLKLDERWKNELDQREIQMIEDRIINKNNFSF